MKFLSGLIVTLYEIVKQTVTRPSMILELHFPIFRSCHDALLANKKAFKHKGKDHLGLFYLLVQFTDIVVSYLVCHLL